MALGLGNTRARLEAEVKGLHESLMTARRRHSEDVIEATEKATSKAKLKKVRGRRAF